MIIKKTVRKDIRNDIFIIGLSIVVAMLLVWANVVYKLLSLIEGFEYIGSFIAGAFFTSIFTTVPAIVALGNIAVGHTILGTAIFGAFGAVIGDLIIFRFVKDRLAGHIQAVIAHSDGAKRARALFKFKFFRWFTFLVGGLIIASPLPDELGVSLLGFSKMKTSWFMILSFVFNFIGIVMIGLVSHALR